MPYKFNPLTGNLDYYESSSVESFKKIASENISALKLVYADVLNCYLADNSDELKTSVIGVALNGANIGEEVEIKTSGELKDIFFNFSIGEKLFLGANGAITNTPPSSGYHVCIGHGLGSGAIFINIESEIVL
jgi:hypothetical protein